MHGLLFGMWLFHKTSPQKPLEHQWIVPGVKAAAALGRCCISRCVMQAMSAASCSICEGKRCQGSFKARPAALSWGPGDLGAQTSQNVVGNIGKYPEIWGNNGKYGEMVKYGEVETVG